MSELYQRPTRIIDLPSGKKAELVEYFTDAETEDIQAEMAKGIILNRADMEAGKQPDIPMENLLHAYQKAKSLALRGLIAEDGTRYDATQENIREFFGVEDGKALNAEITEMINGKKKLTSEAS